MRQHNIIVKLISLFVCMAMFCPILAFAEDSVLKNAETKLTFSALTDQPIDNVYKDFELPVQFEGVTVLWESNNTNALSVEFTDGKLMAKIHPSPFGGGIAFVTLTACLGYNGDFKEKDFVLQIAEDNIGIAAATYITQVRSSFEKKFLSVQNINAITNNLVIPEVEHEYVTYTVKSDTPDVLGDDGTVVRSMEKDVHTTLEVVFSCYEETLKVLYPVTVKAFGDGDVEEMLKTDMEDAISVLQNSYPLNALTGNISLPTSGKYGSTFLWTSNNTSVVSNSGAVTRGASDSSATLTLHGELAGITDAMSVSVTVLKSVNAVPVIPQGGGVGSSPGGSSAAPVTPVTPTIPPAEDTTVFTDLPESHWAYENIMSLYEAGVVDGYDDNTIRPDGNVLREEEVKLIMSAFGLTGEGSYGVKFDDVPETAWYYKVVMQATELGMVNGISDTEFGSGRNITRQDLAVMFYRISGLESIGEDTAFLDADDISDYAKEAVAALENAGVITGDDDGFFNPKGTATRAQAMTMISRLVQLDVI